MGAHRRSTAARIRSSRALLAVTPLLAVLAASCIVPPVLSNPRPVVMASGVRLPADQERMIEIHDWVLAQLETINCRTIVRPGSTPLPMTDVEGRARTGRALPRPRQSVCLFTGSVNVAASVASYRDQDPTINVSVVPGSNDVYPWETLVVQGDTARVQVPRAYPDIRTSYTVYAYLHLMERQKRLERWLPEAAGAGQYEIERAIVKRMADVWLMGRASFYLDPHRGMDELMHASEAGYLDAFLFTARPDEFTEARRKWTSENPRGLEEYRAWFESSFGREPPGVRALRILGNRE